MALPFRYSDMSGAWYTKPVYEPPGLSKNVHAQSTQQRGTKWILIHTHHSTLNMVETLWHCYHHNAYGCATRRHVLWKQVSTFILLLCPGFILNKGSAVSIPHLSLTLGGVSNRTGHLVCLVFESDLLDAGSRNAEPICHAKPSRATTTRPNTPSINNRQG